MIEAPSSHSFARLLCILRITGSVRHTIRAKITVAHPQFWGGELQEAAAIGGSPGLSGAHGKSIALVERGSPTPVRFPAFLDGSGQ